MWLLCAWTRRVVPLVLMMMMVTVRIGGLVVTFCRVVLVGAVDSDVRVVAAIPSQCRLVGEVHGAKAFASAAGDDDLWVDRGEEGRRAARLAAVVAELEDRCLQASGWDVVEEPCRVRKLRLIQPPPLLVRVQLWPPNCGLIVR